MMTATAPGCALSAREVEAIARTCHAANAELQKAHGDEAPSLPWEAEGEEVRQRAVAGVGRALAGVTAEELHAAWCRDMAAEGWRRGAFKDPAAKAHPALVPYGELPEGQRVKDAVFIAIVQAMAGRDGAQAAAGARAELAKVQRAAQTLGMVAEHQARDLYAMWIDVSRGDLEAVREHVLNAIPDGDDNEPGEQWNGTESGGEWLERTREPFTRGGIVAPPSGGCECGSPACRRGPAPVSTDVDL